MLLTQLLEQKGKHKKTLKANARKASDSKVDDEIEEERSNSTNGYGHTEKSISIANEVKGSQTVLSCIIQ